MATRLPLVEKQGLGKKCRKKKFTAIENLKEPAPRKSVFPFLRQFSSPSSLPLQTTSTLKMADEVYDGAIGIDLGMLPIRLI